MIDLSPITMLEPWLELWLHRLRWLALLLAMIVVTVLAWLYGKRAPLRAAIAAQARERAAAEALARAKLGQEKAAADEAEVAGQAASAAHAKVLQIRAERAEAEAKLNALDDDARLAREDNARRRALDRGAGLGSTGT